MKQVIKNVDLKHFQEKVSLAKLGHLDMPRKAYVKDMTILIDELKKSYTIVIVTHSMSQAVRVSQRTGFFHLGKIIEVDTTEKIFKNPGNKMTQDYITGRFG